MTTLTVQPFSLPGIALFWLIIGLTACRGNDPNKQAIATEMTAPTAPSPTQPVRPATSEPDEKNVLYPGQSLWAGGYGLVLESGRDTIGARLTENGEFILYNASERLWTAKNNGNAPGYELILQDDGNLVLYDSAFRPVWASDTHAYLGGKKYRTTEWKPVKLVLEPNLLVLYSATGRRVWSHQAGRISDPK